MPHATFQLRGYCSKSGYDRLDSLLADLCTFYNAALQERKGAWQKCRHSISYNDQCKSLTQIRRDDPDGFGKLSLQTPRGVLAQLDRAMNAFFRRVKAGEKPGFPRFRARSRFQCLDVRAPRPGNIKQRGNKVVVKVKGLPPIMLRPSRPLPDRQALKALRIVRRPTGVTVDLVYEVEKPPLPACLKAVGIDMGVRKRMTLSTGEVIAHAQIDDAPIRRQQQKVSRCKKGSHTRRKQVTQLARLRRKQAIQNRNTCHRLTTEIIKQVGVIVVEKLQIANMTRSAKGTVEQPGKNVAAKSGLNKSIHEQTWGLIRQQLAYKAAWAGRECVEVPAAYTSQDCSGCGHRSHPGASEVYTCPACDLVIDRDVNAAKNILRAGTLARVETQNDISDSVESGI